MIGARENIDATADELRLALPCGHELMVPADLSVPGMSLSVLGHQMSCSTDVAPAGERPEYDFAMETEAPRRGRRSPPVAPMPTSHRRPEGR